MPYPTIPPFPGTAAAAVIRIDDVKCPSGKGRLNIR